MAPTQQLLLTNSGNFWRLPFDQASGFESAEFVLNDTLLLGQVGTLVVHEVVDAAMDFMADATAAAQVFAWRAQLVEAAAVRVLKRSSSQIARSGEDGHSMMASSTPSGGGLVFCAYFEVVDMVCRECRDHFDVDPNDVSKALDKLCIDGVLERRQMSGGGELTELALRPPEAGEDIAPGEVRAILTDLVDTTGITGVNLFRLLLIKFGLPVTMLKVDGAMFEKGMLGLALRREINIPTAQGMF